MYPLDYIEPVFRPPSEWKSLILQVTNGCSYNRCTFCTMYTAENKTFKPQKLDQIEDQLISLVNTGATVSRVFLADGDAMMLPFNRLKDIILLINKYFPNVNRISSYCLPRNLNNKTVEQLAELYELGLKLMYVGCETGDNELLALISKGETYDSSLIALKKIKSAGMKSSVMLLNGLGGSELSKQHIINSAKLMNEAQPDYLSTLVVSFPEGDKKFVAPFNGRFKHITQEELFNEMLLLIKSLDLNKTIFRSDHASNYLALKGILGKDKEKLITQIELALTSPGSITLRKEWERGL